MSVFISFSSADKKIAEKIYDRLKQHGITCWICTRDIPAGADYQACIVDAISRSEVVVLVFSSKANSSTEIAKELSLASKKILIPARIEDVVPQGSFQYQLSNRQFVDMFDDFDEKLEELALRIKSVVESSPGSTPLPEPVRRKKARSADRAKMAAAAGAGTLALAGAAWFFLKPAGPASEAPNSHQVVLTRNAPMGTATVPEEARSSSAPVSSTPSAPAAAPMAIPQQAAVKAEAQAAPEMAGAPAVSRVVETAKESSAAGAPLSISKVVTDILPVLGTTTSHTRISAIRSMAPQLPKNLNALEAAKILDGTSSQRSDAIGVLAPHLADNLSGRDIDTILGDTSSHSRLAAIKTLSDASRFKKNLRADEVKLILEGTDSRRTDAIAIIAPSMAVNLNGADTALVLGGTTSHDRFNAIKTLVSAGRVMQSLPAEDAKTVLDGTGSRRADAIATVAANLRINLDGKQAAAILGDTSSHSRFNAISSLVTAGKIMPALPADDGKIILDGTGSRRADSIAVMAPNFKDSLDGKEAATILGDTSTHDRFSAIGSLTKASKIKSPLVPDDAALILNGTTSRRSDAIGLLAPRVASNLGGRDIATILGDTSAHARLDAVRALATAAKIKKGLATSELPAILENMDPRKTDALAILAPFLPS